MKIKPEVRDDVLRAIRNAGEPITSTELYELPAVRQHFDSRNSLSDHLSYLYRKGTLTRQYKPLAGDQRQRYGYQLRRAIDAPGAETVILNRRGVRITDDGHTIRVYYQGMTLRLDAKPGYADSETDAADATDDA